MHIGMSDFFSKMRRKAGWMASNSGDRASASTVRRLERD